MTTAAEGRTLIKTDTPGWYEDPTTGKKARKKDGDRILTKQEYDKTLALEQAKSATITVPKPALQTTTLSSGKVATSKTLVIKCAWVDPDKRTKAQEKLFAGELKDLTYDAVKKAAGASQAAQPDGRERVIKAQDAFQVRFCTENVAKWRNERRRVMNANRRAERKAAK